MFETLVKSNFLIPSTITMLRSVVNENGLFDQSLRRCEDWDLWLRMAVDYKFYSLPHVLVEYRIHESSLSADPRKMQQAVRAVVEKNFGPEYGNTSEWPRIKRCAYGSVYRYMALTDILRLKNWELAGHSLLRAISIDPELATDVSLFYDLALGSQPVGFRGTKRLLDLDANVQQIKRIFSKMTNSPNEIKPALIKKIMGSAYFASGLVAYNTAQNSLSRKYLLNALYYRPELVFDRLLLGDLVKSNFNPSLIKKFRSIYFSKKPGKAA